MIERLVHAVIALKEEYCINIMGT